MKHLFASVALLAVTFATVPQAGQAAEPVSIKQVEFKGDVKPGSNFVAVVTVLVDKGFYLNPNRVTSPQMFRTDLQVAQLPAIRALPAVFSSGVPKTLPGIKEPVLVYEESFTVNVPLILHPNAVLPLTLPAALSYQATQGTVRRPAAQLRFNLLVPKPTPTPPAK